MFKPQGLQYVIMTAQAKTDFTRTQFRQDKDTCGKITVKLVPDARIYDDDDANRITSAK